MTKIINKHTSQNKVKCMKRELEKFLDTVHELSAKADGLYGDFMKRSEAQSIEKIHKNLL